MIENANNTSSATHSVGAKHLVERFLAIGICFLLLRSAFVHLGNPYYFLGSVFEYRLTGIYTAQAVAATLPFVQLVISVCLLLRIWSLSAWMLGTLTFLLFIAVQISVLAQDRTVSCGCFGATESVTIGWQTLSLSGMGVIGCMIGWVLEYKRLQGNKLPA